MFFAFMALMVYGKLDIREYVKKPTRLAHFLPWMAMIDKKSATILNKDGSFQKSFVFRGPDLDSATEYELINTAEEVNNVLKRLSGGWAFFVEARRMPSENYLESSFPDPVSFLIDAERKDFFQAGNHYESRYYFTLVYLPPSDRINRIEEWFTKRDERKEMIAYEKHRKTFDVEVERIVKLFKDVMPEARPLDHEETLTYLHSCVSLKNHPVQMPKIPMYLDGILGDSWLLSGYKPVLNGQHLRTLTILGFPGESVPGILDKLNRLNIEYRWVTRFIPLDKVDAVKEISTYRRKWFSKRISAMQYAISSLSGEESALVDNDAINKAEDADGAMQDVAEDTVSYGYCTITVTVWDYDKDELENKVLEVEQVINGLGFCTILETTNAVDAWFSSLPGFCRANVRRPLLSSLNLAHCFPLSAMWSGPERNEYFKAPVLMHCESNGFTHFRFDPFIGDVGHSMTIGPTGMGKSVLLSLMAVQSLRYPDAQVYIFDKYGSSRAITAGVGGDFYDLGDESPDALAFQPLVDIHKKNSRTWAYEWTLDILRSEGIKDDPHIKEVLNKGLEYLAEHPVSERRLSGLARFAQPHAPEISKALAPYIDNGPFARMFNSDKDMLKYSRWQTFEMGQLMKLQTPTAPALRYLFYKIEERLTGPPTFIYLDEVWTFLAYQLFANTIEDWLRTFRKKNGSIHFFTQAVTDVKTCSIAPAITSNCLSKIFLPNPNALDPAEFACYESLGLNKREILNIAKAKGKRDYFYKSDKNSRMFQLALRPFAAAYCGASSTEDQRVIREILAQHGKKAFNDIWLRHKGFPDAANWIKNNERKVYSYA